MSSNGSRRKSSATSSVVPAKDNCRLRIERMEAEREQRRKAMQERKKERALEEQRNIAAGNPGDVDFIGMVQKWRQEHASEAISHESSVNEHPAICICVRKRPISDKERSKNDHDSVTVLNPVVWVHSAKFRVDGIQKYLDHSHFRFDHAFDETMSTEDVYRYTTMPLLDFCCSGVGARATVFAYGQTGSGKTYTMNGIQEYLCHDLYAVLSLEDGPQKCTLDNTTVLISFFEMYGGFIQDLLNNRKRLKILEDGKGEINVTGLHEVEASDAEAFLEILERGNSARTTHVTEANDTSSRSHAICQIMLRDRNTEKLLGKFSLVDLAGSERGTDTKAHNSQRRAESADINTSLLALKECIRALDMNKKGPKHVPYRGSKLTLILKDCFTSDRAMTTMIATVSPGASAADHSLNTLRYADRIKGQRGNNSLSQQPLLQTVRNSPKRQAPARSVSAPLQPRPSTTEHTSPKAIRKVTSSVSPSRANSNTSVSPCSTPTRKANAPASLNTSNPTRKVLTPTGGKATTTPTTPSSGKPPTTPRSPTPSRRPATPTAKDDRTPSRSGSPRGGAHTPTANRHPSPLNISSSNGNTTPATTRDTSPFGRASPAEEAELRRIVQGIFEQEEIILNTHMSNIQENAELLSKEGHLLLHVQNEGTASDEDIDNYIDELEGILERKEDMIVALQKKLLKFQEELQKELDLSKKVGSLPQY